MKYMLKMLTQPSTYAGIAAVVTSAAQIAAQQGKGPAIATGIAGLLAIFIDGAPRAA